MSIVQAFATPVEPGSVAASLAVGQKVFEQVKSQLVRMLRLSSLSELAIHIDGLEPSQSCWRPEMGIAVARSPESLKLAALQFALVARPGDRELTVVLDAPGRLFLDGNAWQVRDEVVFRMDCESVEVRSSTGVASFRFEFGNWEVARFPEAGAFLAKAIGNSHPRYVIELCEHSSLGQFPNPVNAKSESMQHSSWADESINEIALALKLVGESSPAYVAWLASVVNGIVLVKGKGISVCSPDFPGLIALQSGLAAIDYVELMICAASQQKLYQLARVFPLTEPGVEEVTYIPARRTYVTTRRVLAAAHEHVNVISLLMTLSSGAGVCTDIERRVQARQLMLEINCMPVLDASRILSISGSELWTRLREVNQANCMSVDS